MFKDFEQHDEPLLPRSMFFRRVGRYAATAALLIGMSWLIGILGYKVLEDMSWIDAILNSAMILGGMGPVNPLQTDAGKLFASLYALFSGMIFLVGAGLVVAPIAHRLLHQFHLDDDSGAQ
ncbi:MAG: hypothetical protein IT319_21960 [Anaerolineae bacterium]|nr:hypothetical protein [Anaerolineae bacterium]